MMRLKTLKRVISGTVSALMIATGTLSFSVVDAADQQTRGNIGGFDYEMWNQNGQGQASMEPKAGSFTCSWSNIENFLARMGKNYDSKKQNYKKIGSHIVLTYDVEYTPRGNSYMCVYGWTRNPLMEYYIVEGWGDWRPPGDGAERKGTVTLNGNTYDIAKTMRYNQPSLDGTATFPQYWSIRQTSGSRNNTTNYMKGTIDVSSHFDAWSKAGLDMSGTLYEVSLNIEGYRSNGSANVKSVNVIENYNEMMADDDSTGTTGTEETPAAKAEADENGRYFTDSFDSGTDGWTGRGGASVKSTTSEKFAGEGSLSVTGRTDSWNGAVKELSTSTFVPGNSYSFSVNAMYQTGASEETFKLTLQYDDGSQTVYSNVATATTSAGDWVSLSNPSYTIPKGASDLQLYVETDDGESDFYIDEAVAAVSGTAVEGAAGPRKVLIGDLNFDENVDSLDMITARKGLLAGGFTDSKTQKAADVDQNKKFETADLVLLQQFILKQITEFPVNKPEVDLTELADKFGNVNLADSWKKDNENNPLTTQRFGADPGWMVYDGRLYIYTTNDAFEYANGGIRDNEYEVRTINCVSTADMVNWTDHGAIPVAYDQGALPNGAAKWAARSWAPDAAWKMINGKPKFFLYFANNGSGIGVLTADSPTGPWSDPIGKELISRNTPNCGNVAWLFDPGVYYDEATDEAYLFFGGGKNDNDGTGYSNPKTGRCVKLGDDMISISGTPQTMDTPYLFEDSSLIKIGDTWYYSYCANWNVPNGTNVNGVSFGNADILYMTSKNPLGPWSSSNLKGVVFQNTATQKIDNGGNNHHSIIYFKDKYYVAYHSRQQEMRMNNGKDRNYRSTQINEATYNASNGTITCRGDMTGVKQIENLDPTQTVRAATMANESKGISVSGVGDTTVQFKKGEWSKVSKVDFSNVSGTLTAKASSKNGAIIKVVAGSRTGDAISYIEVPAGGSMETIETVLADIPSGATDIYFIANGDVSFDSWTMA